MPKSFLIFGAGAIGAYIGGSLALAGQRVVFLERPQAAETLRNRGLRVGIGGMEHTLTNPLIAASLEEALTLGPFEAAVLAVKAYDTQSVIETVRPFAAEMPPVLCLQNGVENEPALAEALGAGKVIAGTVTTAIGRRDIGDVFVERLRGVGVAGSHPGSTALVDVFNRAGLNARLYADPIAMKWSKMLTNVLANATSAILDLSPRQVFSHPGLYRLEVAQLREALAVMRANRISVVDLPGTPVRLLAWAVQSLPVTVSRPLLAQAVGGGRGGKMPSFHIDLHAGRPQSEVEYLNGAIVRCGEQAGIRTPVNRLLTETLVGLASGKQPLEHFRQQPERLLALWRQVQERA